MPGRKQPERHESEDDREYVKWSLREGGENLQGDQGAFLEERGGHGRVKARREGHDLERTQRGGFEAPPREGLPEEEGREGRAGRE